MADGQDERDELASNASSEPIRSAVRASPSRSGTSMRNGRRGAQTHSSAVLSRASSKSALGVPSHSSRQSSTSATSSATATAVASTSASASGSQRNKIYHRTWATAPKPVTASADPSAATSRSSSLSSAPQRKRARDRAEVVIPRLPLETLRQYHHSTGTTRITSRYASTEPSDTSDPYEGYSVIESFEDSEAEEEELYGRRSMARAVKARKGKGRASSDGGHWDDGSSDPLAGSVNGSSEEEEESEESGSDMPRSRRKRQTRGREQRIARPQRNTVSCKSPMLVRGGPVHQLTSRRTVNLHPDEGESSPVVMMARAQTAVARTSRTWKGRVRLMSSLRVTMRTTAKMKTSSSRQRRTHLTTRMTRARRRRNARQIAERLFGQRSRHRIYWTNIGLCVSSPHPMPRRAIE